jgi:hypothetical protein
MWNKKNLVILYDWWWNIVDYDDDDDIPDELECKEVENYDKVMKSYPNYLNIFYNLALVYKQRLKKIIFYLAKVKGDS